MIVSEVRPTSRTDQPVGPSEHRSGGSRTVGPGGGPSSPVAAGGRVTDACTLLTKPEAQALLHKTIARASNRPAGAFVTCAYYAGHELAPLVQVQVNANPYTRSRLASQARATASDAADLETLSGIGDTAYAFRDLPGYLMVLKGAVFFQIVVGDTGHDTTVAEAVAKTVAARL